MFFNVIHEHNLGMLSYISSSTITERFLELNFRIRRNQISIFNISNNSAVLNVINNENNNILNRISVNYFSDTLPSIIYMPCVYEGYYNPYDQFDPYGLTSDQYPNFLHNWYSDLSNDSNSSNDLNRIIINTDLGEISDTLSSTIIEAILIANPNSVVTANELIVIRTTTNSATIISNNTYYTNNVIVHFTINNKNLNNKRQNFNDNRKNDEDKFKKIRKYNYNQQNNINEQSTTTTQRPNAKGCSGSIMEKTNLANILINTYLGELQDNQTETILNKILKLNNNVVKNNIEISTVMDSWASINSVLGSEYEGSVMIRFKLNNNNQK